MGDRRCGMGAQAMVVAWAIGLVLPAGAWSAMAAGLRATLAGLSRSARSRVPAPTS